MSSQPGIGQQSLFHSWQPEALQVEECTTPGCGIRHATRGPCINCRHAAKREAAAPLQAAALSTPTPARKRSVHVRR